MRETERNGERERERESGNKNERESEREGTLPTDFAVDIREPVTIPTMECV